MKAAWILLCAIAIAGCDNTHGKGPFEYGSVAAPDAAFGVVASVAPSIFFPTFGGPCIVAGSPGTFDLRISSANTVSLNQVTFRLGDGGSVGGPSVTIPSTTLSSQFGSTVIIGGGNRILTFPSPFGCATLFPGQLVFVDLVLVNPVGVTRTLTVSSPLR